MSLLLAAARHDPAQVHVLLLQVGGVFLVVTLMALGIGWIMSQGPRAGADARRLRSIVTFKGVVPVEGPGGLGALAATIVEVLRRDGVQVGTLVAGDDAVHLPLELEHDQFVLHVRRGPERFVVQLSERSAANRPPEESAAAPLDRKRTRKVLVAVDAAVRAISTATEVRWHKRERAEAGDFSAGGHDAVA